MSFWVSSILQKTNENNSTWGTIVVKSNFFVLFWGELKIPKRHFEINRPLVWTALRNSFFHYFHISGNRFFINCWGVNLWAEIFAKFTLTGCAIKVYLCLIYDKALFIFVLCIALDWLVTYYRFWGVNQSSLILLLLIKNCMLMNERIFS